MKFSAATASTLLQQHLRYEQAGPSCWQKHCHRCSHLFASVAFIDGCFFYQEHTFVQSLSSLLQSFWPPEATQAQPRAAGSGSAGSRICFSRSDLATKTQPWQRSGGLDVTEDEWQRAMPAKNPAVPAVSMPVERERLGQNPTAPICLPRVPLLFHGEWAYFLY